MVLPFFIDVCIYIVYNLFMTLKISVARYEEIFLANKMGAVICCISEQDEDSNESIEPHELQTFLEDLQLHLPENEIENFFQYCDIDGSKGIQFNEFIVLLCLIHILTEPLSSDNSPKEELAQLGQVFDKIIEIFLFFDQNGDGKLNKKDMVRTMNETNPRERSPAHVTKNRFREMDWDKNGQVTFREFLFGFINWVGIDVDE
ncbi:probable calcium-binding protein CML22 isoform X3 [Medicago truncatula]|uniref:probable calcium-binding protein CML22 isoform X3 n=2 Tax=Medicago truncatula TaxID=3880 RepID=UPI001967551A|nr:probable calcium-binding protein CML22 isoform X3 [Medicago truncatula]